MLNFWGKKPKAKEVILKIKGMHCPSCAMNIDGVLEEIEGVRQAKTNYAKSETILIMDEAGVDMGKVRREITNLGYELE